MPGTERFDQTIARDNEALFTSPVAVDAVYAARESALHDVAPPPPKPVRVIMEPADGDDDPRTASMPRRRIRRVMIRPSDMPDGWPEPQYRDVLTVAGREWTVLQADEPELGLVLFFAEYDVRPGFG